MKCQNCGTENKEENKFCENCGSPLNATGNVNVETFGQKIKETEYSQDPNAGFGYSFGMPNQNGQYAGDMSGQGYGYGTGMNMNIPHKPLKKRGNGFGIASLVCGIVGLVFCWVFLPAWVLGPLAIVFGIVQCCGRRKKGLGIAGILLGAVAIALSIVVFISIDGSSRMTNSEKDHEINRQADRDKAKDNKAESKADDKSSDDVQKDNSVNRKNDSKSENSTGRQEIAGVGSFEIPKDWVYDAEDSYGDLYIYVPEDVDIQYLSDLMIAQAFETQYSFEDKDELIQINKEDVAEQYGVSEDDIKVYIKEDLEVPMIAYEFDAYDEEVALDVKIWEYHVIEDGYIAIFSSIDYIDWEDEHTPVKDCAYNAAKSFVFE